MMGIISIAASIMGIVSGAASMSGIASVTASIMGIVSIAEYMPGIASVTASIMRIVSIVANIIGIDSTAEKNIGIICTSTSIMGVISTVASMLGTLYKCLFFWIIWNLFSRGSGRHIPIILVTIINIIYYFMPASNAPVTVLVVFMVVIPYSLLYEKSNLSAAVFSILLFWDIRSITYFFASSMTTHWFERMMDGIETAPDMTSFVDTRIAIMQVIMETLYMILCAALFFPIKKAVRKRESMSFWELMYLAVPAVSGVFLTMIMTRITVIVKPDNAFILTEEKPELLWQLPLIAGLLYIAELSAIYMWQKNIDFRRQSELVAVQNAEKEMLKKRLQDIEDYYERVKRVRHEMAGHLVNIRGLAEYEEYDRLQTYIEALDDSIRSVTIPVSTGSPVLDIVIGDKTSRAKAADVKMDVKVFYKEEWGIQEYDLGIVIGNILDNAIQATACMTESSDRKVSLEFKEKGAVIFIKCENPYRNVASNDKEENEGDDVWRWQENKGSDRWQKNKGVDGRRWQENKGAEGRRCQENEGVDGWHGLGLLNVRDLAERYGGGIRIEKTDKLFSITVMMKKQ